ncbi:hypothetical protein [Tsuneonella sp. HG222]
MSIALLLAGALVVQAPAQPRADSSLVEVAYNDMAAGQSEAAVDRILRADPRHADHPARLINLGIAHARMGEIEKARTLFERASSRDRYRLETASGEWLDSRDLARQALAMLDRGDFSSTQFAAR